MNMNFDLAPNRRGTDCAKWDGVAAEFGMTPGEDILPLWVADMDFSCAPEILDAVRAAVSPGVLGYRILSPKFHDAVADWMQKRHGMAVCPDCVLPLPSVVAGITAAISAFTEPGAGVIVQPPIYPPFVGVTRDLGRVVLENTLIEQDDGGDLTYAIDFDGLRALAARPDAKMMILCSPHNPIGRVYTKEELAQIVQICAEHGVYLVSDEIHSDLMLDGAKFTPTLAAAGGCSGDRARICQISSPSKTFNTAGAHAAFMIVPNAEERETLRAFWRRLHVPAVSFVAAEVVSAAYGPAAYYADELCAYLSDNMRYVINRLRKAFPGIRLTHPDATYLLWVDLRSCGIPAEEVMPLLCGAARVAPDPGEWFGEAYRGYIRVNVAMPRHLLAEAADRIIEAVSSCTIHG